MTDDLSTKAREVAAELRRTKFYFGGGQHILEEQPQQYYDELHARAADLLDQLTERAERAERERDACEEQFLAKVDEVITEVNCVDEVAARLREAEALLDEIAGSGVVFENEQVDYVEVQIDRDTWAILSKRENQEREGGTE